MSADLECLGQGHKSCKISYFNYYMTDSNKIVTKMIDIRPAVKLVHRLSLEIYVSVTVRKNDNI